MSLRGRSAEIKGPADRLRAPARRRLTALLPHFAGVAAPALRRVHSSRS